MKLYYISKMALDMLCKGNEAKKVGKIIEAKEAYSISWAFNQYQEYYLGITICDNLLRKLGVEDDELERLHSYGQEMVEFSFNLADTVNEMFNKPKLSNFTSF